MYGLDVRNYTWAIETELGKNYLVNNNHHELKMEQVKSSLSKAEIDWIEKDVQNTNKILNKVVCLNEILNTPGIYAVITGFSTDLKNKKLVSEGLSMIVGKSAIRDYCARMGLSEREKEFMDKDFENSRDIYEADGKIPGIHIPLTPEIIKAISIGGRLNTKEKIISKIIYCRKMRLFYDGEMADIIFPEFYCSSWSKVTRIIPVTEIKKLVSDIAKNKNAFIGI